MADTTFTDQQTRIVAAWLNDVNKNTYLAAVPAFGTWRYVLKTRSILECLPSALDPSTTDISSYAQSFIEDMADQGVAVFWPSGTYLCYLNMPDNLSMYGEGRRSIIKLPDGTNRSVLRSFSTTAGSNDVELYNLAIDGNKANQNAIAGQGLAAAGIDFDGPCENWLLDKIYVYETQGEGLHGRGGGSGGAATVARNIQMNRMWLKNCGYVQAGALGREGVYLNHVQEFLFTNSVVDGSGRQAFAMEGSGNQTVATRRGVVANSIFSNSTSGGVDDEANEGGEFLLIGNLSYLNGGVGFRVTGLTGRSMVCANHSILNGSRGVDAEFSQSSYVSCGLLAHNVIVESGSTGLNVNVGAFAVIAHNNVSVAGTNNTANDNFGYRITGADSNCFIFDGNLLNGSAGEGYLFNRSTAGSKIVNNTANNPTGPGFSVATDGVTSHVGLLFSGNTARDDGAGTMTSGFRFADLDGAILTENTSLGETANSVVWAGREENVILNDNNWNRSTWSGAPNSYKATQVGTMSVEGILGMTSAPSALTVASNTVTPTQNIHTLSGTPLIKTITPPSPLSGGAGIVTIIPAGAFTTDTTGNIARTITATANKPVTFTYNSGTSLWYPAE